MEKTDGEKKGEGKMSFSGLCSTEEGAFKLQRDPGSNRESTHLAQRKRWEREKE